MQQRLAAFSAIATVMEMKNWEIATQSPDNAFVSTTPKASTASCVHEIITENHKTAVSATFNVKAERC